MYYGSYYYRTVMSNTKSTSDKRRDGRIMSTELFLHEYYKHLNPNLSFNPEFSENELAAWRGRVIEKLRELMQFSEFDESQPEPNIVHTTEYEDYTLHKVEVFPEPFSVVPVLVLIPKRKQKMPAVLCIAGSSGTKEMLAGEPELTGKPTANKHPERNKMAWHFAKAGFVSVAMENPGVGELRNPNDDEHARYPQTRDAYSAQMMMMGRNYPGLTTFNGLAILRWLKSLNEVDTGKIVVSGHSLGTEPGMFITLLDDDVQALVFNDFVGDNRKRIVALDPQDSPLYGTKMWHCIPDFFRWFAFPDILAACAPKPLIITEGGVADDIEKIRKAYDRAGMPQNLSVHFYEKYKNAEDRPYDGVPLPEGLSQNEYLRRANVDVPNHYFKEYLAIPWLKEVFSL